MNKERKGIRVMYKYITFQAQVAVPKTMGGATMVMDGENEAAETAVDTHTHSTSLIDFLSHPGIWL